MFMQSQVNYYLKSLKVAVGLILLIFSFLIPSLHATELTSNCVADASATYTNLGNVAYTWDGNYSGGTVKTFWKFSIDALTGAVAGTYVRIDDAKLVLYGGNEGSQYTNLPTAKVYQVLDNSWSETGVTEVNAPPFGMALGSYDYPGYFNEVSISCTDYIQTMLDSGSETISFGSQAPNNYVDSANANRFRMIAREFANSTYRPKLAISYTIINVNALTVACEADASATYANLGTASYTWDGNYSGGTVKTFWKFPLADLIGAVGTRARICNAKLVLYGGNEGSQYTNLPTALVYQVLNNSWSETGVTESNAPPFGTALGSYDYPGVFQMVSINCTAYIQKLLDSGNETISFGSQAPNNYVDSANANRFRMIAREYSNSTYRPKLVINYMTVPEIDAALAPVVSPSIGATTTPITHQQYFRGERELFAYAPLYTPAPVSFDQDNVPYIRVGENADGHDIYSESTKLGLIQTLDANGRWVYLRNFTQAIQTAYPSWNGEYSASVSMDERIAFDDDGDAYMTVETFYSMGFNVLLHSKDKCRTWTVYALPAYHQTRLEIPDGHNYTSRPPVIVALPYGFTGVRIDLICPVKNADGTLTIPTPAIITPDDKNWITPALGNATITKDNLTHVVYDSLTAVTGHAGTPQYIVTYNHITEAVTTPVLLGVSDSTVPDLHDGPSITIDSSGYLHVVMGAHHGNFQYTKSLSPNLSTAGWTTPVSIGRPKGGGGWSYVSLVCDKNDTLHVIGRYAGYFYHFGLWYIRKPSGGSWQDLGPLVMPFRNYYSHWYQALTVNSDGGLFLSYIYYGCQYDRGRTTTYEMDAYKLKWPWEDPYMADPVLDTWGGTQGHDPTVIMSDDGGNSWHLMLTTDLVQ